MIVWLTSAALAGAWTKAPGEVYAKLGADTFVTTRYVAPDIDARKASYTGLQLSAYGEVGLVERLQLTAALPFVVGSSVTTVDSAIDTFDVRTTSLSLGDLWVGPQVALLPDRPLSLRLDAKVPLYGLNGIGRRDPIYGILYPAPGDGQVDLVPRLAGGLSHQALFAEAHAGWMFRTGLGWDDAARSFGDGPVFGVKGGAAASGWLGWLAFDGQLAVALQDRTRQWLTVSGGGGRRVAGAVSVEARVAYDVWTSAISQGVSAGLGLSVAPGPP